MAILQEKESAGAKFQRLFGFGLGELGSWNRFVRLMNRPEDPSSLALLRILFGFMMLIDIPNERGMSDADIEYGNKMTCTFPLFNFLQPLSVEWMLVLYTVMLLGSVGIILGFKFRLSCLCFLIPYWYFFLLDKTTWNNHSYLYGLIGFLLFISDANRYCSLDVLFDDSIRNVDVPLWNYCLFRTQIFIVYFLAGLKKLNLDWILGYSMTNLSHHWVFDPFKYFLSLDQITLIMVHGGGLFIDLFAGYLLFFDRTRLLGTIITASFHIMNSQMFSIGMFPYTMLASTTIFYSNNWPKRLLFPQQEKTAASRLSKHCIYEKLDKEEDDKKENDNKRHTKTSAYHKFFALFTILYIGEQLALPYSHFITKGYNNWTNGLYGYSWDMMVHSWHTQHIKISFVDKSTNKTHYLNPKAWTTRRRWSSHGDMIYQYAKCIETRLRTRHHYRDIELHMDVWRSMNHRFHQRQLDPRVDLTKATWHPLKDTPWIMPLLSELSDWRDKMREIEERFSQENVNVVLTFVADFPGLSLENFVSKDLNASIEVLQGEVSVELKNKPNVTLGVGERAQVPSGAYHKVYTVSSEPSCFFYVYLNDTAASLSGYYQTFLNNSMAYYRGIAKGSQHRNYKWAINKTMRHCYVNFWDMMLYNVSNSPSRHEKRELRHEMDRVFAEKKFNKTTIRDEFMSAVYTHLQDSAQNAKQTFYSRVARRLNNHIDRFKRSFTMVYYALKSIVKRQNFMDLLNKEFYVD